MPCLGTFEQRMSPRTHPSPIRPDERPGRGAERFLVGVATDGDVVFAGPSVPDVLGFDRTTLVGSDLLEFVHPDERKPVSNVVSAVSTGRRVTHRFRHASGGYAWVESVVDDELAPEFGGRVLTARRLDVERTFPERFRAFLEYGTDIVTVVDGDGLVRYESPSVEEVLGYEQGSLVGRSPLGYVHPDDRERVTEGFYRALSDPDASGSLEFRYRTAADDWVWLESRTRALPDDAVTGRLVINSRDISDRKRRERRLTDRNERLDRFASIVSHDLRNPLSVVRGSMEMAKLKDDTEPLDRGERAVDRIDQLITELLTLAKQGQRVDDPTEFTLAEVVHDAWETTGTDDANLDVRGNARVYADRSRLRQAFENLFRNCVEHGSTGSRPQAGGDSPSRGPDSGLDDHRSDLHGPDSGSRETGRPCGPGTEPDEPGRARSETPAVTLVVAATENGFLVADDGPGIDPDHHQEVFEPGFTTEADGTGYGLDIVREVIDAHGWSIRVADGSESIDRADDASGARFLVRAPTRTDVVDEPWIDPIGTTAERR